VSLLPALLHVRGVERLSVLVQLVREESLREAARAASWCSRGWSSCC
jgi:hypothetical protein